VIYRCVTIGGVHGVRGSADGTNGASLFNQPWGIAVDENGSVYVAEWGNSTIRKLTLIHTNWVVSTIVGTAGKEGSVDGTNADALLNHPHGIAVDNKGDIYVADTFNNTIRKVRHIGSNWVVTTIAGRVGVFGSIDGTNLNAEFNNPGGITLDRRGNLYVTDVQNNTIRKLTPMGSNWIVTTIAGFAGRIRDGRVLREAYGSANGTNSNARFFAPFGIAADSQGDLYVADYENSAIRKIARAGTNWIVTTIAGLAEQSGYVDGTNSAARFDHPRAIAVDKADNIYVDDTGTDTIRLIKSVGTNYVVKTIVGLPWRWGYADGTNNTPQFNSASGITVDKNGNIYLADTGNDTVRQIVPPPVPPNHTIWIIAGLVSVLVLLVGFLALRRILRQRNYQP
jgi:streptogramin lyase